MPNRDKKARKMRLRRRKRIRGKISGSPQRPRLSFFKSSKHVYAQVIDDHSGATLVAVHSFGDVLQQLQKKIPDFSGSRADKQVCTYLGGEMAKVCLEKGVKQVVFDRGGFPYHGRVKAFAEAAREGGLVF